MATRAESRIDEYLRDRLMPVEGTIPHLARTDIYGNSIPAGSVGSVSGCTSSSWSSTRAVVSSLRPWRGSPTMRT